eukprot:SAG11_NODE_8864_length_968_cov_1.713464_1_plen_35_part_01
MSSELLNLVGPGSVGARNAAKNTPDLPPQKIAAKF